MAALDTNVLVRLCMVDDADQCRRGLVFIQKHAPVFVTQLSLLELVWVLGSVYRRPKEVILPALRALLDNQDLNPEAPLVLAAALDRWEGSGTDFADCFILEVVQANGQAPLATFDRTFGKQPGTLLL